VDTSITKPAANAPPSCRIVARTASTVRSALTVPTAVGSGAVTTQLPSPFPHTVTAVHAVPVPDWAAVSLHVRSAAASHAVVHALQEPAQSVSATLTQASSPSAQSVVAGHAAPVPDWAAVSLHVRSAAASHAVVHRDIKFNSYLYTRGLRGYKVQIYNSLHYTTQSAKLSTFRSSSAQCWFL
jgi:hypothetical protein